MSEAFYLSDIVLDGFCRAVAEWETDQVESFIEGREKKEVCIIGLIFGTGGDYNTVIVNSPWDEDVTKEILAELAKEISEQEAVEVLSRP